MVYLQNPRRHFGADRQECLSYCCSLLWWRRHSCLRSDQNQSAGAFFQTIDGGGVRGQRAIEPGAQRTPARGLVGKRKRRQPLARPAAERPERAREDRLDLGRGELLVVEDV